MNKLLFAISVLLTLIELCHTDQVIDEWWKNSIIYQIYPRSFKDSNGDGVGDLKGITEKAGHFSENEIGCVWLSPIYKSPMADFGYDISDFKKIDPIFGTLDDFTGLLKTLKSKGVRLLLDFVPNHSSDEHEWFQKSIEKEDPYTNYYVWKDPKGWINDTVPIPPNNWICAFEGSAWEYVPKRKQFYLHQFAIKQPDLNYRNEKLKQEMLDTMKYWLDLGVDGFRMDAVPFLYEDAELKDESIICNDSVISGYPAWKCLHHINTQNQDEAYTLVEEYRSIIDQYSMKGNSRVFLAEAYASLDDTVKYYGTDEHPGAHMPFNFLLLQNTWKSTASDFRDAIDRYMKKVPKGRWMNWVLGNHDQSRVGSKYGKELIDGMHMLSMLLPGTAISYNGEEIGMTDTKIRWDETTDVNGLNAGPDYYEKFSRDPERTPFQWDSSVNAGFSSTENKTWLPINPNFWKVNLKNEKDAVRSHLKIYQILAKLRSHDVFRKGAVHTYVLSERVFAFTRTLDGFEPYVVVINFDSIQQKIKLSKNIPELKEKLFVHISSLNSEHQPGNVVYSVEFDMRQKSAVVLSSSESLIPQSADVLSSTEFDLRSKSSLVLSSEFLSEPFRHWTTTEKVSTPQSTKTFSPSGSTNSESENQKNLDTNSASHTTAAASFIFLTNVLLLANLVN